MKFAIHDETTAPEASRATLEATQKTLGFIPNLYGVFAESPTALLAYSALGDSLKQSALSAIEQQVVALAVSTENKCSYCVAAHSFIATMVDMPGLTLRQLRARATLSDKKRDALHRFTLAVVRERGWVPKAETEAFLAAGYTQRHLLDVLTVVAMKTLSNYVNHIAETPLDEAFASQRWSSRDEGQAA